MLRKGTLAALLAASVTLTACSSDDETNETAGCGELPPAQIVAYVDDVNVSGIVRAVDAQATGPVAVAAAKEAREEIVSRTLDLCSREGDQPVESAVAILVDQFESGQIPLELPALQQNDEARAEQYVNALNTFCGDLLDTQNKLEKDVERAAGSAEADPGAATKALADVLRGYAGVLTSGLATLEKTPAPADYETFDQELNDGITEVAEIADDTARQLDDVDLSGVADGDQSGLDELRRALSNLNRTENPLEDLEAPRDLQDETPRCQELSG